MIYVYDIILNWSSNNELYDFFEWELNDELENVKKMPLIKIDSDILDKMFNYDFYIKKDLLGRIDNLTETYFTNKTGLIKYACLFTDGLRALAVKFDEDGNGILKSKLLLDEEQEVLMLSSKLNRYDIEIETCSSKKSLSFETRHEKEIRTVLLEDLNNCYNNCNFDKLKYLYFECFDDEESDSEVAFNKLVKSMDNGINKVHHKLYELVMLSYTNKN